MSYDDLSIRQKEIVKIIYSSKEPITGDFLARKLNVTSRTIRTEIKNINATMNNNVIQSSSYGYLTNINSPVIIENFSFNNRNRNFEILELLLKNDNLIDMYDLSEFVYVSYSTLTRCLKELKPIIENHNLQLIRIKNSVKIRGSEYSKRELIKFLIYNDLEPIFLKTNNYLPFFKEIDLNFVEKTIIETLKKSNYHSEEIYIMNLVINISIALDRILNGYSDLEFCLTYDIDKELEIYKIAKEMIDVFEHHYNFKIQKTDVDYIAYLIMGQIKPKLSEHKTFNQLEYIDDVTKNEIYKALTKIFTYYLLDIDIREFFNSFIIHIDSLVIRNKSGAKVINIFIDTLKSNCPFIYEVAVEITKELSSILNVDIYDDEIGFIAIHIGYAIEQSTHSTSKVKTLIINSDYHQSTNKIINRLSEKYPETLEIENVSYSELNIKSIEKFDLIISTINNNISPNMIFVSPLLNDVDLKTIDDKIDIIKNRKFSSEMQILTHKYLRNDLFFINEHLVHQVVNEISAMKFLCNVLQSKNLIDEHFLNRVLERETLSSTCINKQFAIPHALNIDSNESVISILISKQPVKWYGSSVNMIIMLAFSETDLKDFMNTYDVFCKFLCNESNFDSILKVQNYEQFINMLNKYL